jgi:hypothetical protein
MIRHLLIAFAVIALGMGYQGIALAIVCPPQPEQSIRDWEVEVNAAVAKIGPVSGGELKTKTKNATQDMLGKLPNADRVYLEQMLLATYCSALRDDKALSESQKTQRLNEYIGEVRKTIQQTPITKRETGASPVRPPRIAPSLPVPYAIPSAPPHRAETCGAVSFKTRSRARFVPRWVNHINALRDARGDEEDHDLQNLMAVRGEQRTPVDEGSIPQSILVQEAFYTLKCLAKEGQLRTAKPDHLSMVEGLVENQRIIFLKPIMTVPE